MSIRLYILPVETHPTANMRGPKYLEWNKGFASSSAIVLDTPDGPFKVGAPPTSFTEWQVYGQHPWAVVALAGHYVLTPGADARFPESWSEGPYDADAHVALAAKPDVLAVPSVLTTPVGTPALASVRSFLESAAIPGEWINASAPWRQVIRMVCGLIIFAQAFDGLTGAGVTPLGTQLQGNLNAQWRNLPTATRDTALAASLILGYDTSFINGTDSVRSILKTFADLWGDKPVYFGLNPLNGGAPFEV